MWEEAVFESVILIIHIISSCHSHYSHCMHLMLFKVKRACLQKHRQSWQVEILNSSRSRPQQLSTYALTLYKYTATVGNKTVAVGMYCAFAFVLLLGATGYNFTQLKIIFSSLNQQVRIRLHVASAEMPFVFYPQISGTRPVRRGFRACIPHTTTKHMHASW